MNPAAAVARGRFRTVAEDFRVEEVLGFEPDGEGEHLLLRVEKRGVNTEWVAAQLAACAGVTRMAVGFAGLKDRHAVAEQTFSVHLPGRQDCDPSTWAIEGVRVLAQARHRRKLSRGAHRGNRFQLVLRAVEGEHDSIEARLREIAAGGFPNAFGAQRFGRGGANTVAAESWFARGGRLSAARRGLLLSSARSAIFNAALAARMADDSWNRLLPGEVAVLQGSRSWFAVGEDEAAALVTRLAAGDIHPSGPLWGRGVLPTSGAVRAVEEAAARAFPVLAGGLERAGLKQERRALRAWAHELTWRWDGTTSLCLDCRLDRGVFMTSLLARLGEFVDAQALVESAQG